MRKILILLISVTILSACKAGRQMTPAEPPAPREEEQVVEIPEEPVEAPVDIPVVEENFEFERIEDEAAQQVNRFFVILGSFRVNENANKFKSQLENMGFSPVILLSETGLHRISVDSFKQEADARHRVLQIRRNYPEYHDAWLLIRRDL